MFAVHLIILIMLINMGLADRMIRIAVAAVFAFLYFTQVVTGTFAIVLLVLAGVLVLTSAMGYCPLYGPLGISTCRKGTGT